MRRRLKGLLIRFERGWSAMPTRHTAEELERAQRVIKDYEQLSEGDQAIINGGISALLARAAMGEAQKSA